MAEEVKALALDDGAIELWPVERVARALGVSVRTVWKLVASRELPRPIRLGRNTRWCVRSLREFIARREALAQGIATDTRKST